MSNRYHETAFTPAVRRLQERAGSDERYAAAGARGTPNDRFTARERQYIAERDGFYLATVSEAGWPYVQFRGGPPGFVRVLDEATLGWADFRGNQQFVSAGNAAAGDGRAALILTDYPNRRRLKLFGNLTFTAAADAPDLVARLAVAGYRATVDRAAVVRLEGFDWNCPQHIPQRFTPDEMADALAPLRARLEALEEENRALRRRLGDGAAGQD
jgi:predicted pyridoxine 5'-phosphate oxidase superfamily flavin-nucleotide-binding protein